MSQLPKRDVPAEPGRAAESPTLEPLQERLASELRAEAHGMARAYVNALLAHVHRESIVSVHAKGSAYRAWDSSIDYVPELSDVDIHVRFRDPDARPLRDLTRALDIGRRALATFAALHPGPCHVPRVHVTPLSDLECTAGYRASPAHTVHTLFGEPYEGAEPADYEGVAVVDARRFQDDAGFVLSELSLKVVDRPGARSWSVVSRLAGRVGPAGPRLLTQLGHDPYDAWSMNRTAVVGALSAYGPPELAAAYADFYLAGWQGYRSRFEDGDAARLALLAVERFYRLGKARLGGG